MKKHKGTGPFCEADQQSAAELTLSTGTGKTWAGIATMWEMLNTDDDPVDLNEVPMTDRELDDILAAVKSRTVAPLPPEIEELGDSKQFMKEKPRKEVRESRLLHSFSDLSLIRKVRDKIDHFGMVEEVSDASRYLDETSHHPVGSLSFEEFYWEFGFDSMRAVRKGLSDALLYAYESERERRAPFMRAHKPTQRILSEVRKWRPSFGHAQERVPRWEHSDSQPGSLFFKCHARPPAEEPQYLLALFVVRSADPVGLQSRLPAWFTCSETTVTQAARPPSLAGGRWSLVLNLATPPDITADNVSFQTAVIRLPEKLHIDSQSRGDLKRLWETSWKSKVLELMGESK